LKPALTISPIDTKSLEVIFGEIKCCFQESGNAVSITTFPCPFLAKPCTLSRT